METIGLEGRIWKQQYGTRVEKSVVASGVYKRGVGRKTQIFVKSAYLCLLRCQADRDAWLG